MPTQQTTLLLAHCSECLREFQMKFHNWRGESITPKNIDTEVLSLQAWVGNPAEKDMGDVALCLCPVPLSFPLGSDINASTYSLYLTLLDCFGEDPPDRAVGKPCSAS